VKGICWRFTVSWPVRTMLQPVQQRVAKAL